MTTDTGFTVDLSGLGFGLSDTPNTNAIVNSIGPRQPIIVLTNYDGETSILTGGEVDTWYEDDDYISPYYFEDDIYDEDDLDRTFRGLHTQHDTLAARNDLTDEGRTVLRAHKEALAREDQVRHDWHVNNDEDEGEDDTVDVDATYCNGYLDAFQGEIVHMSPCPKHPSL